MSPQLLIFLGSFFVVFSLINAQLGINFCSLAFQVILGFFVGNIISFIATLYLPHSFVPELYKKAVFITGCDSGFGNELAQRLDSLGVTVYAGCLFADGPLAKELKQKTSEGLHIVQLDVTKQNEVDEAVKYVKETLKDKVLVTIVNNAGIATFGEMEWHSLEDTHKVMDVNVFGQIRMVNAFLPLLRESKGRIVNIVSVAAHYSVVAWVPYCMSKYASLAYSDGIRRELKKFSISVHSIEPSTYLTPILKTDQTSLLWDQLPDNLKELYGMNYYEVLKKNYKAIMRWVLHPDSQIYQVVDSLVDASVGSNPKVRYSPSLLCYILYLMMKWDILTMLDSFF